MIIITGPGRSGTSVLAQLYKELGFDPGGEWFTEIQGGLEPPEVVEVNEEILEALGLSPMGAPGGGRRRVRRAGKAMIPPRYRAWLRYALRRMPWMGSSQPSLMRWEDLDQTVAEFAPRLHAIAQRYRVTKDPRFFWTLPVWAAAQVPIDHVLISIRNLDATVKSRARMDSLRFHGESGARNSVIYGLGLTLYGLEDHGIPYSLVRFPDFLTEPETLFQAARFPEPVDRDRFSEVFQGLARPELVHDHR
jgi:hypothetical protein